VPCVASPFAKYADAACAGVIGSNKNVSCTVVGAGTTPALLSTCTPTFTLKCPMNNGDAKTMPFIVSTGTDKPMQCQACGITPTMTDLDPRPGMYQVELKFGRNAIGANILEASITGYHIHAINEAGVSLATVGSVPRQDFGASTCCDPAAYSVVVSNGKETMPETMWGFKIVPYQVMSGKTYDIAPFGTITGQFNDLVVGTANVVEAVMMLTNMSQADARSLIDNPDYNVIMSKAIMEGSTGITMAMIVMGIPTLIQPTTRRLGDRRLAGNFGVNSPYTLILPSTVTFTKESIDADKFKKSVQTQAGVVVGSITVAEPKIVIVDTAPISGDARPMCGNVLFSFLALVIARMIM